MSSEIFAPYIGVKPAISTRSSAPSNTELIHGYVQSGYSYVLVSITNTQYRERSKRAFQRAKVSSDLEVGCPGSQDVNILAGPHTQKTIGLLASWIDLENVNELIADFSRQVLFHELEYAKFIGLKHIIIAPPKDLLRLSRFSSTIQEMLRCTEQQNMIISISLPICEEFENNSLDPLSTWDMWNSIRTSVDYNPRLKISLALTKNGIPMAVVNRWFAEPISCVLISSSIFLINNKGYPVLSKPNQQVLHIFQAKSPILLLHGLEKAPGHVDPASYLQYLDYIMVKNQPEMSTIGKFGARYNDVLLPPLQPLHNNLDDFTYNIFEQDEVKYDLYGKAINCALSELSHLSKINIAIVGAGKGGLVEAAFNTVQMLQLHTKCHITAIEKNNSAVVYLDQRNHLNWNSSVQILNMDMRQWSPKESYNIIVSELLGSFGCNELSPECLKPLEQQLDRENGVFIPQSYTSHLAPVFTPKLHQILKSQMDTLAFHKQYVVKLLEVAPCSNKVSDLWTFTHPSIKASFKKTSISTFKIRHKTVIHGLAGYFTAKLYKDIEISIRPDTHTTDLISWFPLFFPLEQPLYVTDDTELEVSMARECRGSKVWYSWSLETFMYLVVPGEHSNELQVRVRTNISKIHNDGGEGFTVEQEIL
jgi:protein arginine N-methyltransferase 5